MSDLRTNPKNSLEHSPVRASSCSKLTLNLEAGLGDIKGKGHYKKAVEKKRYEKQK